MNYLLDTCVFIWALSDTKKLSKKVLDIISNSSNNVYISAVTPWEMSIKKSLGKLTCPDNIDEVIKESDFKELPISIAHTLELSRLGEYHKDPFDRMLIAQAREEKLTVITNDEKFSDYEVKIIQN